MQRAFHDHPSAPGIYNVEVSLSGFAPFKRDNVIVEVGRTTTLDVGARRRRTGGDGPGHAETPIINTDQSDFSTNINQTTIANLPTNTRRWSTFALMTPGAAPDGNFGLVSFRGISGLLNSNTVDGGDNTQAFFAEERGRTRLAYSVSADAVREFQVTTSNYSAEYGRAAGGVVNAVTKSGTNELHGSGFYFLRDNKWGASNPFQTQTVLVNGVSTAVPLKPKDRRQQFGGTVGGPIEKDKLFFFFSYDQQARKFPGVAAPSNPAAFFAPSRPAELDTLATRGVSVAQAERRARVPAGPDRRRRSHRRPDAHPSEDRLPDLNNNHSLAVTYNRLRWDSPAGVQTAAVVNRGVESWGNDGVDDDWATARLNSVLGSRMTNEIRFQWGRDFEFQSSQDPLTGEPVSANGRTPEVDDLGHRRAGLRQAELPRSPLVSGRAPRRHRRHVHDLAGRTPDQDRCGLQPRVRHARQPLPGRRAPTPTAAASTSSPTTRRRRTACRRARNYTSFARASARRRSRSIRSTTTSSSRTRGASTRARR